MSGFAPALAALRAARGLSQMALSLEAEVSTRHISFLENGRARPSRDMVRRLADALALGAVEREALMAAAGFHAPLRPPGPAALPGHGAVELGVLLDIEAADSAEAAVEVAGRALAAIGVPHFFTGVLLPSDEPDGGTIVHHHVVRAPLGWLLHYRERGFRAVDPLVRETGRRHLPFFWSDVLPARERRSAPVRRMLDEGTEFGIHEGFVAPVHRADGSVHALSSMAGRLDLRDPALRVRARTVAVALLHRLDALGLPEAHAELTLAPALGDQLAHVLDGRDADWIAARCRRDVATVLRDLSEACRQFGTGEPLEAALRARRAGLLPC